MRRAPWLLVALLAVGCAGTRGPPRVDRADVALAEGGFAALHAEHVAVQKAITELEGARQQLMAADLELAAAVGELEGLRAAEGAAEQAEEALRRRREETGNGADLAHRARLAGEAKVEWKEESLVSAGAAVAVHEARARLARAQLEQARLQVLVDRDSPALDAYPPETFAKEVARARDELVDAQAEFSDAEASERAAEARYRRLAEGLPGA